MSLIITRMNKLNLWLQRLRNLSLLLRMFTRRKRLKSEFRAINDAIANLQIALANVRNSIPAEMKWPVKTKKILTNIRMGIPADIAGIRE